MRLTGSGVAATLVAAVTPGADPLNFAAGTTPEILQSDPLAEETDLGATVLEYHFTARDSNGLDIAHGFTQLRALPAIARTVGEASLPVAGPGLLEITVIEPDDTERPAVADLSGVTTLDEAAARHQRSLPADPGLGGAESPRRRTPRAPWPQEPTPALSTNGCISRPWAAAPAGA